MIESDFDYISYKNVIHHSYSTSGVFSLVEIMMGDSTLFKSTKIVLEHSKPFKEVVRFVAKSQIHYQETSDSPLLFNLLYENRYVEESLESEVIRYKILTDWIDRNKKVDENKE